MSKKTPKSRENPLRYKTKSGKELTESETQFVKLYIEYRGDRVKAVLGSYNVDIHKPNWHATARGIAYENLTKPYILEAIREIMGKHVINDEIVDQELAFVIEQHAELSPKVKAISEYNKITNRYTEDKVSPEVTVKVQIL